MSPNNVLSVQAPLYHGQLGTAREFSDRGLTVSPREPRLLACRVVLEYEEGDFDQGETYLERLLELIGYSPPGPTIDQLFPAIVIPMVGYISGVANRLDVAEAAARTILSSSAVTPVLLAIQRGDVATAEEQYSALKPARVQTIVVLLGMEGNRMLGLLARTMGNLEQAAAHFEDALAVCRNAGYRPHLAWTCCDYADMLLDPSTSSERMGEGDRAKASALLDESLAISSELGMRPLMERVLSRREILGA